MSDIKPGKRFFTVVYEITDPAAFQPTAEHASARQASDEVDPIIGARVTACGWGDYATSYDALEHYVRANGEDADSLVEDYVLDQELSVAARDITG